MFFRYVSRLCEAVSNMFSTVYNVKYVFENSLCALLARIDSVNPKSLFGKNLPALSTAVHL